MSGLSRKEHLKLVSNNPNAFSVELARRNSPPPAHDSLVAKAQRTFGSIGEAFSDTSAIALYDAKALTDTPDFCKEYLKHITATSADNFYSNISGEKTLVDTLSAYGKKLGLAHTEKQNILVTAGAVNAFFSLCYALCEEGDVILALSPSYILFSHSVRTFGAEMVLVPSVREDKFTVTPETLEDQILAVRSSGRRIKAVLVVNPTNIDAQCWTEKEISALAPVLIKYNLPVIEDRVYDGLQYDAPSDAGFFANHIDLAARTITIDSVSKKYGATQWRIGWIYGPEKLIDLARECVMQSVWSPNSKYQLATAMMLQSSMNDQNDIWRQRHDRFMEDTRANYKFRRDLTLYLINGKENYDRLPWDCLQEPSVIEEKLMSYDLSVLESGVCGFSAPVLPQAGMFLLVQASPEIYERLADYKYPDLIFAKLLYKEANVVMLPPTELTLPEEERMFRMEVGIDLTLLVEAMKSIHIFTERFLALSPEDIHALTEKHLSDVEIYATKAFYDNAVAL